MKEIKAANGILEVPHLGITLRTLMAAAAAADPERLRWSLHYKQIEIGKIRVQNQANRAPETKE